MANLLESAAKHAKSLLRDESPFEQRPELSAYAKARLARGEPKLRIDRERLLPRR